MDKLLRLGHIVWGPGGAVLYFADALYFPIKLPCSWRKCTWNVGTKFAWYGLLDSVLEFSSHLHSCSVSHAHEMQVKIYDIWNANENVFDRWVKLTSTHEALLLSPKILLSLSHLQCESCTWNASENMDAWQLGEIDKYTRSPSSLSYNFIVMHMICKWKFGCMNNG